jgi:hypothetical protein
MPRDLIWKPVGCVLNVYGHSIKSTHQFRLNFIYNSRQYFCNKMMQIWKKNTCRCNISRCFFQFHRRIKYQEHSKSSTCQSEKETDKQGDAGWFKGTKHRLTTNMIAPWLMLVAIDVTLANQVSGIPLMQICPTISHWRTADLPDLSVILFEHFTFFL